MTRRARIVLALAAVGLGVSAGALLVGDRVGRDHVLGKRVEPPQKWRRAAAGTPCSADTEFRETPGLGRACRLAPGLYRLRLRDGTDVTSHGPDDQAASHGTSLAPGDPERPPACASPDDYALQALYTRRSSDPDTLASNLARFRSSVARVNAVLNSEAAETGGVGADYRFVCDASGQVDVRSFVSSSASFSDVMSAAKAAGYGSGLRKYVIFAEWTSADAGGYCGIGTLSYDSRPGSDNPNNVGPDWGLSVKECWDGRTPMHELTHNLGAVNKDAPDTSGAGHCVDGLDVMCYADGGTSGTYSSTVCTDELHLDCGHDTYFHANPPAGSYLASHWNVGSPATMGRWIRFGTSGTASPSPTTTPSPSPSPSPSPAPVSSPSPGAAVVFSDGFEAAGAWTRNADGLDTATGGLWERGDPQRTSSSGVKQLGRAAAGANDLVTGRLAGSGANSYDVDGGRTSIRSPSIGLPAGRRITIRFSYYLAHGSNSSTSDYLRVSVVGASTATVFEQRGTATNVNGAWKQASFDLSGFAGQTIYLVVEAVDAATASLVEAAIDEVVLEAS